ncbi:NudC domain-containing protein 3 [Geranomyces michiganensis]|nr:NudC domain-containing protein 3 [Geranomyces michiganensis]
MTAACVVHQTEVPGTHNVGFYEKIAGAFDDETLSDFTVKAASGRAFHCSKLLLGAHSQYFKGMFAGSYDECQKNEVVIPEVDEDILQKCLKWMYTGRIILDMQPLTANHVISLHALADRLLITSLSDQLYERLKTWPVDELTFDELYMFALSRDCQELKEKVYRFMTVDIAASAAAKKLYERLTTEQIAEFMAGLLRLKSG